MEKDTVVKINSLSELSHAQLKKALALVHQDEVSKIYRQYLDAQKSRIITENQIRAAEHHNAKVSHIIRNRYLPENEKEEWKDDDNIEIYNVLLASNVNEQHLKDMTFQQYLLQCNAKHEDMMKKAIIKLMENNAVARWLQSITGFGPLTAAVIASELDIRKAPTSGHFESYTGFTESGVLKKGVKANHNAFLKTKIWFTFNGMFKMSLKNKKCFYGTLIRDIYDVQKQRNERGDFKELAYANLDRLRVKEKSNPKYKMAKGDLETYGVGKLKNSHLLKRSYRVAIKIFLSHLHAVMFALWFKSEPPVPYIFSQFANNPHVHYIGIPNISEEVLDPKTVGILNNFMDVTMARWNGHRLDRPLFDRPHYTLADLDIMRQSEDCSLPGIEED